MAGRFSVEAVFKAVDRVSAPVSRMQNKVGQFTRSMESGITQASKRMDSIGKSMMNGAKMAAIPLGVISLAFADIIKTGAEFEQTLVGAASKFGGIKKGSAVYKELEAAARKAGKTTEFSATQSAEALTELAAAGLNVKTSIRALPSVIDLATAAGMDLAQATQITADSMGAFGLMSEDPVQAVKNMNRVMDVMSMTADASTLSVEQIFESFKKAGPIATAAGLQIETVASMLGVMAGAGVKAELAGTAVQNMLLNMASPTSKARNMMKQLGISFKDSTGNFKDMPTIIDQLNKSMSGMTAPQKAAALEALFGREGLGGMVAMVNAGGNAFQDFRTKVDGALGSTANKAAMMRDTFSGSMKSLDSAIEDVKISIFAMNSGPLKEVVDRMTEWVRANGTLIASKLGNFLKTIIDNLDTIVVWVKRIGIALGIFIALTTVLRTFVLIMTAVNLVMALNPIGLIVLAIAAAIIALTALGMWLYSIRDVFIDFGRAIVDNVIGAFTWLKEMFTSLPGPVQAAIAVITGPIGWLIAAAGLVMDNWAPIKSFFANLWGGVTGIFNSALGVITGIVEKITNMASAVVDTISNLGMGAADFLGFGGATPALQPATQMVSPQERIARNIEEKRTSAEVTISDRTGTAQVTNSTMGPGLKVRHTGGF